jgi:hypothetical protein
VSSCDLRMKIEANPIDIYRVSVLSRRGHGDLSIRLGDELERGSDSGATGQVSVGKSGKAARTLGRRMGLSWATCAVGERETGWAGSGFWPTRLREKEKAFPFTNPFIKANQFESK